MMQPLTSANDTDGTVVCVFNSPSDPGKDMTIVKSFRDNARIQK